MAKTYAQIQAQIHKLQQEADTLKAKETAGVVARIQDAITHYGLTPADLFGKAPVAAGRKSAGQRTASAAKPDKRSKTAPPKKAPAPVKFQDDAGNHWSGIGKRPNWFKAALAAGKTADELLRKPVA